GPLVTGSRLKSGDGGLASTASLGTMAKVGFPNRAGSVDRGWSRSKCTTLGAVTLMPARSLAVPLGSLKAANPVIGSRRNDVVAVDPRRARRSSEYLTSVAVTGRPLLNFAEGLMVKSQWAWSGVAVDERAENKGKKSSHGGLRRRLGLRRSGRRPDAPALGRRARAPLQHRWPEPSSSASGTGTPRAARQDLECHPSTRCAFAAVHDAGPESGPLTAEPEYRDEPVGDRRRPCRRSPRACPGTSPPPGRPRGARRRGRGR